jgi:TonB family protein
MFNNLIESTSHAKEFKRRGSFLLFTTATYVVLFVVTGVVSIYAYDAHLESQSTELELLTFVPVPQPDPPAEVPRNTIRPASDTNNNVTQSTRVGELIDTASNPNNVPDRIGTVAPSVPPARPDSVLGNVNADPVTPAGGRGVPGGTGNTPVVDMVEPPPPAAPNPTPVVPKVIKISRVLNGEARLLPKPNYPPLARQIRLQGSVNVQVLIDETGRVVSAKAMSGHPLLVPEAQRAAMMARFSPTIIGEQPVRISGVIIYNFVMQ